MASGSADRLDVTAWIAPARGAPAARSGWEAAGVAARSGDAPQDRFGEALSAARVQDEAAAARTRGAAQRGETDAARARQATQRNQVEANRATVERTRADIRAEGARAQDIRAQDSRAQDSRAGPARPATGAPDGRPENAQAGCSQAERSPAPAAASTDRKADAPAAQPSGAERAAARPSEAPASATDAAATADTVTQTNDQADAAPEMQTVEPAAQPAPADPSAALLALLATLAEGGPVRTTAAGDASAGVGESQTGDGTAETKAGALGSASATASAAAAPGLHAASTAGSAPRDREAVTGIAEAKAGGAAPVPPVSPGSAGKDSATVEAGPGDAVPDAVMAGKDFLAALADAGQGTGAAPPPGSPPPAAIASQPAATQATPASASGAAQAAAPQAPAPSRTEPPIPIGQVPMTIGLRSLGGSNEFQIRLDPVELVRIDVKLAIDKAHGTVMTHLVVDRPETLAMLQRDAGQLQQALSQAGLDPSGGGLNLSLRGDGGAQGGGAQQDNAPRGGAAPRFRDPGEAPQEIAPTRWLRGYGGVDIRI